MNEIKTKMAGGNDAGIEQASGGASKRGPRPRFSEKLFGKMRRAALDGQARLTLAFSSRAELAPFRGRTTPISR